MSSLLIESNHPESTSQNDIKNHPVKSTVVSKRINNVDTDIAISVFADTIFITISQNQKFNTWIKAYKAEGVLLEEPSYHIETLLGSNQEKLLNIYARQLIEFIGLSSNKQLLLSISITDKSKDSFKQILQTIAANKIW